MKLVKLERFTSPYITVPKALVADKKDTNKNKTAEGNEKLFRTLNFHKTLKSIVAQGNYW